MSVLPIGAKVLGRAARVSLAGGGFFYGVYDGAVVVAVVAHELEELRQGHAMFAQEGAVAGAAIHEVGVHLAAEFDARFHDEPWEPCDAVHLGRFCGKLGHGDDATGGFAVHDVEEVFAADGGDGERGLEIQVIVAERVVHEIEQLLRGAADGGEKCDIARREHGVRRLAPRSPCRDAAIPHCEKFLFPVFVHRPWSVERHGMAGQLPRRLKCAALAEARQRGVLSSRSVEALEHGEEEFPARLGELAAKADGFSITLEFDERHTAIVLLPFAQRFVDAFDFAPAKVACETNGAYAVGDAGHVSATSDDDFSADGHQRGRNQEHAAEKKWDSEKGYLPVELPFHNLSAVDAAQRQS